MIKSMTGFGRGEYSDDNRNILVELKSVNHRYSDITVKTSRRYAFAEEGIRNTIKKSIKRGKIDVSVMIENLTENDVEIKLNEDAAGQYIANLRRLQEKYDLEGEITIDLVAGMPDVLKTMPNVENEEEINTAIEKALSAAIENLEEMRAVEGEKLAQDLMMRTNLIRRYVSEIKERVPEVVEEYKETLKERLDELLEGKTEAPEERVLLEAAVFADKTSITEELVRLDSHLSQMDAILSQGESSGKKLDFLVQEMNREANTIGSKTSDLDITNKMLEIKSEVEKIREQVQNIE